MSNSYQTYTDITLSAFKHNPRNHDLIARKSDILSSVALHYSVQPESILFFGFSPWILGTTCDQIFVTEISDTAKILLDEHNVKYTYIVESELSNYYKQFSWVVAGEEYFTFAENESAQRHKVELLSDLASSLIITTLRDYKNQDFKDREFSQPIAIKSSSESLIFLEYNDYEFNERNLWKSLVYQLQQDTQLVYGPFDRASMYFKQLAKFSIDAGAENFFIHKNLMYKSLIKKNYEHVISIPFK